MALSYTEWSTTTCSKCGGALTCMMLTYTGDDGQSIIPAPAIPTMCSCPPMGLFEEIDGLKEVISGVRNLRQDMGLRATVELQLRGQVSDPLWFRLFMRHQDVLRTNHVELVEGAKDGPSATILAGSSVFYIPLVGVCDLEVERGRLEKSLKKERLNLSQISSRAEAKDFISKAAPHVVADVLSKLDASQKRCAHLEESLLNLEG